MAGWGPATTDAPAPSDGSGWGPAAPPKDEGLGVYLRHIKEDLKLRSQNAGAITAPLNATDFGIPDLSNPQSAVMQVTMPGLSPRIQAIGQQAIAPVMAAFDTFVGRPAAAAANAVNAATGIAPGYEVDPHAISDIASVAVPVAGEAMTEAQIARAADAAGISRQAYATAQAQGRAAAEAAARTRAAMAKAPEAAPVPAAEAPPPAPPEEPTPAPAEPATSPTSPAAAAVAETTPAPVVLEPGGNLTPDGREIAAANDIHPDDLRAAYAEAPKPKAPAAPVESAAPVEAPPPEPPPATAVARVEQAASEGVPLSQGQATQDFATQARENTLRNTQDATPEAEQARQFFNNQQTQIQDATNRFQTAIGDTEGTAETRGQMVKDALRDLRENGRAGVSALYTQGRDLLASVGDNAKALLDLNTDPLLTKMREIQVDRVIPQTVRDALRQEMARYGLIGEPAKTVEGISSVRLLDDEGKTAETIRFAGPQEKLNVTNAEDLRKTVNDLFSQDPSHRSQALKPILDNAVEDAITRAAEQTTAGAKGAEAATAIKAGRAAHADLKRTFDSGDAVSQIIAWKKGSPGLDAMKPEDVIRTIFGSGPDAITNLRRVKGVLLANPTPQSLAAWNAIRSHGVARIFNEATVLNSNPGSGLLGTISGAKLNTAVTRFGIDKLRVLLGETDFNQMMKLRRIIGDATIPINGTTNPSGTAAKVVEFLNKYASHLHHVPVVGPLGSGVVNAVKGVGHLAKIGEEAGATKETLRGITSYRPEQTAAAAHAARLDASGVRDFLTTASQPEVLTPYFAATSTSATNQREQAQ